MTLHYETVSDALLSILRKIMEADIFADFRLVGGTSLSLQRGHRRSIDIELFTDLDYGKMQVDKIKDFFETQFQIHEGTETLTQSALGYHIRLCDGDGPIVKVDLFYTDKYIFPVIEQDGLRLADEREIAAMKLLAIAGPVKRQKDYWDIHELLQSYSLPQMIEWALARHPYSLCLEDIIEGFSCINDVEESPEGIDTLRPLEYWELKILDLKDAISQYCNDCNKEDGED